jgi:hypothetical protein
MSIAYQSGSSGANAPSSSSTTTTSVTVGTAVPAGAAVCIAVFWVGSATTVSISDNVGGNTYSQVDQNTSGTAYPMTTFYGVNIKNGPTTFTATIGTAHSYLAMAVDCFTGVATSAALDGHAMQAQSSPGTGANAITSRTFTEANSGDLTWSSVAGTGSGHTATPGTGYTLALTVPNYDAFTEYNLASSAGSNAGTWTDTQGGATGFVTGALALKAAGAALKHPSALPLLGAGWMTPSRALALCGGATLIRAIRRNPLLSRRRLLGRAR